MKKIVQSLIVAMGLFAAANSAMAVWTQGTVYYAGTYANGDVFVLLTTGANIAEPGCNTQKQFYVLANNPGAKQVLAVAMSALLTGRTIGVSTTGCQNGYPLVGPAGYLLSF